MNLKNILLTILIVLIVFVVIKNTMFFGQNEEAVFKSEILTQKTLGYCPSMEKEAYLLKEDKNYSLVKYDSSKEVLEGLKKNKIDSALVGRKAKENEISENTSLEVLSSGYTLVSKNKLEIDISQVSLFKVYTVLSKDVIESDYSFLNIEYLKDSSLVEGYIKNGEVVLISWDEYKDNYELLVVYDGLLKHKSFRGVFLYY